MLKAVSTKPGSAQPANNAFERSGHAPAPARNSLCAERASGLGVRPLRG